MPEQAILLWDMLWNDDRWIVAVPDRSFETITRAVDAILDMAGDMEWYNWDDEVGEIPWWAFAQIIFDRDSHFVVLNKHLDSDFGKEDRPCLCEEEGWWCQDNDGPSALFYEIDRSVIHRLGDALYGRMDALGLTDG